MLPSFILCFSRKLLPEISAVEANAGVVQNRGIDLVEI